MSQTKLNLAYGYQIRIAGLIRRGADQHKIDSLRAELENLIKEIEGAQSCK